MKKSVQAAACALALVAAAVMPTAASADAFSGGSATVGSTPAHGINIQGCIPFPTTFTWICGSVTL
jgi:hypothetical protein